MTSHMSPNTTLLSVLILSLFTACNSSASKVAVSGDEKPETQQNTQTKSAADVTGKPSGGDTKEKPMAMEEQSKGNTSQDILRPGDPRFDCGTVIALPDVQTACSIPYAIITHKREGTDPKLACWRRFSGPKDERLSIIIADFESPERAKNLKHPGNATTIAPSETHDEGYSYIETKAEQFDWATARVRKDELVVTVRSITDRGDPSPCSLESLRIIAKMVASKIPAVPSS